MISFNPKAHAVQLTEGNVEEMRTFLGADTAKVAKDGKLVKFEQDAKAAEKDQNLPVEIPVGYYAVRFIGIVEVLSERHFGTLMI